MCVVYSGKDVKAALEAKIYNLGLMTLAFASMFWPSKVVTRPRHCCFFHYLVVVLYYLSLLSFTVNKDEYKTDSTYDVT